MSPEHSIPSVSIFGGEYNAKTRSLEQIAESFIAPVKPFRRLTRGDNTILIGPRGSGKTTLLTMLQGPALELSPSPEAQLARERVSYTAVLVPCDQAWAGQLRSLTLEGGAARRFARAQFVLHALRALVNAAATRLEQSPVEYAHRRVKLKPLEVAAIAQQAARDWGLSGVVADFRDLEETITREIARLGRLRSTEEFRDSSSRDDRIAKEPLLHLDLVNDALTFIGMFNNACGEREGRWAFLFDELELAPADLSDMILGLLRGVDKRLLFKISYAPYEGEIAAIPHGPAEGQDYSVLRLSYANKREAFDFTRALLEQRMAQAKLSGSPAELLGETGLIEDDQDAPDMPAAAYAPDAAAGEALRLLAERDPTFAAWLRSNAIDLRSLPAADEALRARVRKAMPSVLLRLELVRPEQTALRSRRNIALYSGETAFLAMTEANPRWLEHICDQMLERVSGPLPPSRQSRVFMDAAREFTSYLHILPVRGTHLTADDAPRRLLDRIGEFFRDSQIRGPFTGDPVGSFVVDARVPPAVEQSLQALVNRGALIEVPNRELPSVGPLRGRRYRVAYLLAPLYHLPLRLDKSVELSTVLQRSRGHDQLTFDDVEA